MTDRIDGLESRTIIDIPNFPYVFMLPTQPRERRKEALEWCQDHLGDEMVEKRWQHMYGVVFVREATDAVLFKMRFG